MLRAALVVLVLALPARSQDRMPVDLELVLLADATSSIDAVELGLQRRGYAAALVDPQVLRAIRDGGAGSTNCRRKGR